MIPSWCAASSASAICRNHERLVPRHRTGAELVCQRRAFHQFEHQPGCGPLLAIQSLHAVHGGNVRMVQRGENSGFTPEASHALRILHDALDALARREPRRVQVVELRYFGGLSVEETAEALQVSPQTVMRDWKLARAWLAVELRR
jgi:RNA polymerase sigma factor (sigma-70 family)